MKTILITIFLFISVLAHAQVDTITTAQGKNYIGKEVILKGKLVGIKNYTAKDGKELMYLDIDDRYPNNPVGVTIFTEALPNLKITQADVDKKVKITGLVELYRDKPTISIRKAENIVVE